MEEKDPRSNWEENWKRLTLRGLGPANSSFLLKMAHDILPNQERVDKTGRRKNAGARGESLREGCANQIDDRAHSLFTHKGNNGVGLGILKGIRTFLPDITIPAILRLEYDGDPDIQMPLTWLLADSLRNLWQSREDKVTISAEDIRTSVEANWKILKDTKYAEIAGRIGLMIREFF